MANRRMLSREVCSSDWFIEMPLSAQALYMHLNLNADDDGCVARAQQIVNCIGASADDFRILLAKGYLIELNNKLYVISDWLNSNQIRADRKVSSIYMDELSKLKIDENRRYSLTKGMGLLEYFAKKEQEAEEAKKAREARKAKEAE